MPTYDFECKKCKSHYEARTSYDEKGKYAGVECPGCGSKSKKKLVSCCSFSFSNPVGTDRYENSHDYRFHHKLPSVLAERQAAEEAAAFEQPYNNINDLNIDSAWGGEGNSPEADIEL